jgi:hypothetical protein
LALTKRRSFEKRCDPAVRQLAEDTDPQLWPEDGQPLASWEWRLLLLLLLAHLRYLGLLRGVSWS